MQQCRKVPQSHRLHRSQQPWSKLLCLCAHKAKLHCNHILTCNLAQVHVHASSEPASKDLTTQAVAAMFNSLHYMSGTH